MDLSPDERDQLAALFNGVAHSARIAILQGLAENKPLTAVVDDVSVTRGTLQTHVERMIESDLVYRPSDGDQTYALTPLGEYVLTLIEEEAPVLLQAAERVEEEEASIEESLEAAGVSMDESTRTKTVHTQKWEDTLDEIRSMLEEDSVE